MSVRRRGRWSAAERLRLAELALRTPLDELARVLQRSPDSVRRHIAALAPPRRAAAGWTAADEPGFRLACGVHPPETIARLLGVPEAAVLARIERGRAAAAADRPWSDDEIAWLKRHYGARGDADLAVALERRPDEIAAAAAELCLAKDKALRLEPVRRMPRWAPQDIAELRGLYPGHDNLEIARRLGRSVQSVANKASQLGLVKARATLRELGRVNVALRRDRRGPVS